MYGNLYLEYNSLVSLVMQNKAEKVIDLLETESVELQYMISGKSNKGQNEKRAKQVQI